MNADAVVRARIPLTIKEQAIDNLQKAGLTVSDFIRLALTAVANGDPIPYKLDFPKNINLNKMTNEEFDEAMRRSLESVRLGRVKPAEEAFAEIRRELHKEFKL